VAVDEIVRAIRGIMPELQRLGVADLRVFGSHVRGDAGPESDIDVLVQLDPADFDRYCKVLDLLEAVLGRKVDLVMVEALKPAMRDRVLNEAIRVA
jgi:predicted nucleotidyltransferase